MKDTIERDPRLIGMDNHLKDARECLGRALGVLHRIESNPHLKEKLEELPILARIACTAAETAYISLRSVEWEMMKPTPEEMASAVEWYEQLKAEENLRRKQ